MLVFLFLSILSLLFFFVKNEHGKGKMLIRVVAFVLFCTVFWNITYFVDRYNYEVMFNNIDSYDTDFIYRVLSLVAQNYGWSFDDIYLFHIVFIAFFCVLFIARFTSQVLFIVLMLCIFRYVDFANQIRYYLGFFIALNALYLLIAKRYFGIGAFLSVIAILSHFSLILLFLILFFYKLLAKFKLKFIIMFNIIILFSMSMIMKFVNYLFPSYFKYFDNPDGQSSILGGLFDAFPAIIVFFLVFFNHKKVNGDEIMSRDKKYKFLYSLSVFSFFFISIGFLFRIVADRFVLSFSVVWLLLLVYSIKYHAPSNWFKQKCLIFINVLVMILWFYFSSYFLFGDGYYFNEALLMLYLDF